MADIMIKNAPETLKKHFGKSVDFIDFVPLEWDGMDWCYNGEVIPTKEDACAFNWANKWNENGKDFLESLLK